MTGGAFAGFIGDADGNVVTATAGSGDGGHVPGWMVDGSGMSPSDPVVKSSLMINDQNGWGMWASTENPKPSDEEKWVLFTFANATSLQEMVIWNYNQNSDANGYPLLWQRGLKDVTITYSTGADASGLGGTLFAGQLNHASGADAHAYTDDLTFAPVADVKAVRIAYTSNWDDSTYAYNAGVYGLSEVRFSAVPEPSSLLLITLGAIGLMAYAGRKKGDNVLG
jgi:hypothetical protein